MTEYKMKNEQVGWLQEVRKEKNVGLLENSPMDDKESDITHE